MPPDFKFDEADNPAPHSLSCAVCGAKNPASAAFCATCGASLAVTTTPAPASVNPAPHPHILAKGTRLHNGQYALGEMIGQGGFGITYRAGDMQLRRYVAIKEFFPSGASRQGAAVIAGAGISAESFEQARRDFIAEAQTLARFSHPSIVRVYGVFEENNTAYMVMEFIEGHSLGSVLQKSGSLEQNQALEFISQVGGALQIVHGAGLLHRDIKPDNILLATDSNQKQRAILIDFGTARKFSTDKTHAMTAQLTPGYAPLEQYGQQARFGPYTDVYALAGTLYHTLTGQIPTSALDRLNGVDLAPPHQLKPTVSQGVSNAILHALEIKAPERPQSVSAFLDELRAASAPAPATQTFQPAPTATAWSSGTSTPTQYPFPPSTASPHDPTPLAAKRQVSPWLLGALGVTLFMGLMSLRPSSPRVTIDPTPMPRTVWVFPTFAPAPPPQPTSAPDGGFSANNGTFPDYTIFDECSSAIEGAVFNNSPDIVMDSFNQNTSEAGYSGNNTYWATGQFSYFGNPTDFSFGTGRVYLTGRDDPKGYSLGSWRMEIRYLPSTADWDILSMQISSL